MLVCVRVCAIRAIIFFATMSLCMSGEVTLVHEFPPTVGVNAKETSTCMVRKHVCPQLTFEYEGSVTFGTVMARFIPSKYSLRMDCVPVDLTKVLPLTKLAYKVQK